MERLMGNIFNTAAMAAGNKVSGGVGNYMGDIDFTTKMGQSLIKEYMRMGNK